MTHYFINDNNLESNIKKININIGNGHYTVYSDNGVFSKDGLDFGTKLLLDSLPIKKMTGNILDVGCGYGIIGIYIASNTDSNVDMIDVNRRALHLTKMNVKENNLTNTKVFESDAYQSVTDKYDFIITNPPIRAGKKVVYKIIFEAQKHLEKNGELWLVIRKDQGAKSLLKDMDKVYKTEITVKNKGFFVISAKIR